MLFWVVVCDVLTTCLRFKIQGQHSRHKVFGLPQKGVAIVTIPANQESDYNTLLLHYHQLRLPLSECHLILMLLFNMNVVVGVSSSKPMLTATTRKAVKKPKPVFRVPCQVHEIPGSV